MEVKKYPLVTFSKELNSNIVYVTFKENLQVDIEAVKELISNRHDFTKDQDHFLIIDLTNINQVTAEAKMYAYSSEDGSRNILGSAFIVSNPVSKLIANIFVKTEIKIPTGIFTNNESAISWINELKNKR